MNAAASSMLPTPRRTLVRLRRAWLIGLFFFGYGPAFTYGWCTWLLNDYQWFWTYLMYFTLVPVVGGCGVIGLPLWWYRPIHRALEDWTAGRPVERQRCLMVYERALHLPGQVALSAFGSALVGYLLGTGIVHWQSNQPWIETVPKTLPAIPLVGGMMGAFCYFGTSRAMQPVLAWCSLQVRQVQVGRRVSLAAKFLGTTCVLSIATLCLLLPAAYRLGQVIIEEQLMERGLQRLELSATRLIVATQPAIQIGLVQSAAIGARGYAFATDAQGRILSSHPRHYTHVRQERFYQWESRLTGQTGAWVDRVGQHRVVVYVRLDQPAWTLISVALPDDFSAPLHHFVEFSWVLLLEVLFVVVLFGRYYTRSITTPLAELTQAARRIAESGELSQYVPVTTNDELSDMARSFNRMVERLQASKADLEDYTRRLEHSAQELASVNQEMEDLLRVVSHDLRAPLINIQGFSRRLEPIMQEAIRTLDQLAAHSTDNGARGQVTAIKGAVQTRFTESLQFISKGVEKMDTLLSLLLAISRVGRKADPVQPHDLDTIVDDVLATFDHQLNEAAIRVLRHPLPQAVPCRRNEINQVFSNMISNAIKYMGTSEQRFIEIGSTQHDDHVECFVRDTGIGIAPEDQERIFQMFTRLQAVDAPGEGIGLAYIKKILRSHGGRIWVTSVRGQGSTFSFTLPMQPVAVRG